MIQGGDTGLRLRLDALEAKGLRLILDQARRQAVSRAFAWAAPASAVGGVVFVLSALIQRPSPVVGLAAVVLPPLVVGGVTYLGVRRAQSIERAAALARLDQRFGIKDRIQTADEFSRIADRSSFQSAALQEASPWLDRGKTSDVLATAVISSLRQSLEGRSESWTLISESMGNASAPSDLTDQMLAEVRT